MNAGDKGEIGSTEKYRIFDEQAPQPVVVVLVVVVVGIEGVMMALVVVIVVVIVLRVVFLVVKLSAMVT